MKNIQEFTQTRRTCDACQSSFDLEEGDINYVVIKDCKSVRGLPPYTLETINLQFKCPVCGKDIGAGRGIPTTWMQSARLRGPTDEWMEKRNKELEWDTRAKMEARSREIEEAKRAQELLEEAERKLWGPPPAKEPAPTKKWWQII